jgi:hypothetical protein
MGAPILSAIFMFPCEPLAHVNSHESGNPDFLEAWIPH